MSRQDLIVTLFTTPKPFHGAIGRSQDRAIQSWIRLGPSCEIILVGDDDGVADAAERFGVRHIETVDRNDFGTPLVSSVFAKAEAAAQGSILCYLNADIILTSDFLQAIQLIGLERFLLIGQRWDIDPSHIPEFTEQGWEGKLQNCIAAHGSMLTPDGIDYFVFTPGLWPCIPPFALGRTTWDNWLVYKARALHAAVIDATPVVRVVHQNHGYSHHQGGRAGLWKGPEAQRNLGIAGGFRRVYYVTDSDWVMLPQGLVRRPQTRSRVQRAYRYLYTLPIMHPGWSTAFRVLKPLWRLRHMPRRIAHGIIRSATRGSRVR